MKGDAGPYDDIIGLDRPSSPGRPKMPRADRAAQFAPFAALTGLDEAVEETARIVMKEAGQEEGS